VASARQLGGSDLADRARVHALTTPVRAGGGVHATAVRATVRAAVVVVLAPVHRCDDDRQGARIERGALSRAACAASGSEVLSQREWNRAHLSRASAERV
jgi:hypothetical protein